MSRRCVLSVRSHNGQYVLVPLLMTNWASLCLGLVFSLSNIDMYLFLLLGQTGPPCVAALCSLYPTSIPEEISRRGGGSAETFLAASVLIGYVSGIQWPAVRSRLSPSIADRPPTRTCPLGEYIASTVFRLERAIATFKQAVNVPRFCRSRNALSFFLTRYN